MKTVASVWKLLSRILSMINNSYLFNKIVAIETNQYKTIIPTIWRIDLILLASKL